MASQGWVTIDDEERDGPQMTKEAGPCSAVVCGVGTRYAEPQPALHLGLHIGERASQLRQQAPHGFARRIAGRGQIQTKTQQLPRPIRVAYI